MSRRVSIADARNHLTRILREVERGVIVEVTRRGQPVAALIPMSEYRRLRTDPPSVAAAAATFRDEVGEKALRRLEGAFDDLRDRDPGREVEP
jgi:prevent-host-death family protein